MNDAQRFIQDHPDIKLNEMTEEQIPVTTMTPEPTKDGVNIKMKDVLVTRKTMYIDAPMQKAICAQGKHQFYQKDAGKSLYACNRCMYRVKAHPPTYKFDPTAGTLTHRKTGSMI